MGSDWEYKAVEIDQSQYPNGYGQYEWNEHVLAELGNEGWELVKWDDSCQIAHGMLKRLREEEDMNTEDRIQKMYGDDIHDAIYPRDKWEYLVENVYADNRANEPWIQQWNEELNARGEEGWELVQLDGVRATFKRPKAVEMPRSVNSPVAYFAETPDGNLSLASSDEPGIGPWNR